MIPPSSVARLRAIGKALREKSQKVCDSTRIQHRSKLKAMLSLPIPPSSLSQCNKSDQTELIRSGLIWTKQLLGDGGGGTMWQVYGPKSPVGMVLNNWRRSGRGGRVWGEKRGWSGISIQTHIWKCLRWRSNWLFTRLVILSLSFSPSGNT